MSASATDRDKIKRIFRFLQELHQVKSPPVVDLAVYEWTLSYDAVPGYASVVRGDVDSGFILKVARPSESQCPRPSVAIEKWLKPDWEQFGVEPEFHARRKTTSVAGKDIVEAFEESRERVEAFEKWYEQRRAWEAAEKSAHGSLNVFLDLFDLYGKFEREAERLQLFLADGVLRIHKPGVVIQHPIYTFYASLPVRPGGLTAVEDQQIAAGVMWVLGSLAYTVTFLVGFYRWLEPDRSAGSPPAPLTT